MTISTIHCNCDGCIHKNCCKYKEQLKNFLSTLKSNKNSDNNFIELDYKCKYYQNFCAINTNTCITPYKPETSPSPNIIQVGDWPPSPYIATCGDNPNLSNISTTTAIDKTVHAWNGDAAAPSRHFSSN